MKKHCIAMLLAGGQGSRLYALTAKVAKPSLPFGGKYRIIDFPLSNCANSGIDTVGVLTQYQPLLLNRYIGSGQAWDLDSIDGGVYILPPYQSAGERGSWFSGTANAIYQNINFINRYDPSYVVILSGDHIYKMDYSKMLEFHKEKQADCTIAVMEVPWEEASRFGIMACDEDKKIYEFAEKPKEPKSNLASMGIYIFTWSKLKKYLEEDEANPDSENDFGKNVIPAMLQNGERMYAYAFEGYWKDVGTIDSLWEANMDLLDPNVPLDLYDDSWKIYARNPVMPPQYVADGAVTQNAMISEGCYVEGEVDFSILFAGVTVEKGAVVHDSIVMPGSVIKAGAVVEYSIVAEDVVVGENALVGCRPENMEDKQNWGVTVIAKGIQIGKGAKVPAKAMIEQDVPEVSGDDE